MNGDGPAMHRSASNTMAGKLTGLPGGTIPGRVILTL